MADTREEEQRKHVVGEIVQTEATFVADLNVRIFCYYHQLSRSL